MTRPMVLTAVAMFAMATYFAGCSQAPVPPKAPAKTAAAKPANHGHSHDDHHHHRHHDHGAGPHGGTLADWGGGKYHVEFTVDHDKKEAVIYVLGTDEKTPAPIKAADGKLLLTVREPAFQVELVARPLSGEAESTSSCYGGMHESLGIIREFAGTISGEVDGTPFAGDFAEEQ